MGGGTAGGGMRAFRGRRLNPSPPPPSPIPHPTPFPRPSHSSPQGFPDEFRIYFEYCRALRFADKPDYSYLRRLFKDLALRNEVGAPL